MENGPSYYPPADPSESHSERLARKSREAPFVPIGLAGLATAVLYGAYKYKNRGAMSTSIYLMHLRVTAQGLVVAALTAGVTYSMFQNHVMPKIQAARPDKKEK